MLRPALLHSVKPEVLSQNANIIKAPGQEHHLFPTPGAESFHGFPEGKPLFPETGFLDSRQFADTAVQMAVNPRLHHHLEFIRHNQFLRNPNRADLDDLSPDGYAQCLLSGGRTGPGLVPFHIQNDIIHSLFL